ncbi:glycosyltransferase family 1 protein [Synechococcus sp. RSCCF101]|uniref:glycosyltransferase family 4 protein n=1 Tax=Synechococcus sp. RSCCF101 TaxID=2511069 RepID=UPI001245AF6B|nr:glycosyltransferase family 1 protein [Synechococcus sp. RSCCF101]QEY32346.1 glycosyltransferase family 1 protein [Synechococcus sp. RSCCF101]
MLALVQGGHIGQLHPYCPDPLLAGSVRAELEALEAASGLTLGQRPAGGPAPRLPDPGTRLKRVLKPLYRRLLGSGRMRAVAQRNFDSTLARCSRANTVFHTPFQSVPPEVRRSGIGSVVVTVHDMLPRIHPEFFTEETIRHFSEMIDLLQAGDHVICVSESTRRDFLRFNRVVPESHVHVTPLAASPELRPVRDPARLESHRRALAIREGEQVILSLCTLEPRKNLTTLIDAFEALRQSGTAEGVRLVLAGSMGWKTTALTERIRTSSESEAITVTGHIPDADLALLYSCADVFVYPSLYEGFGLPPLEAMQCGTPVIVGATSSLPEVVGEAALLVDPRSAGELSAAMARLLGSSEQRRLLGQRALEQAARFSWQRTAADTAEVYGRTLAG